MKPWLPLFSPPTMASTSPPTTTHGRFWTEEDEILLLDTLLSYRNTTGRGPSFPEEKQEFHALARKSLHNKQFKERQLLDKIRRLKDKYYHNNKNRNDNGNLHDQVASDLAMMIWGGGSREEGGSGSRKVRAREEENAGAPPEEESRKKPRRRRESGVDVVAEPVVVVVVETPTASPPVEVVVEEKEGGLCPVLSYVADRLEEEVDGVMQGVLKSAVAKIRPEVGKVLERRFKRYLAGEATQRRRWLEITSEVMGALEEVLANST